jgi:DEAD/DEAH box helicase domain-containing protein
VFIAREDPLDTYLVHHPEAVFDAPIEATVFDPHNPYVLAGQLCTAAAELPLRPSELDMFGGSVALGLLDQLTERGTLRRRELGWYWTHEQNAADFTSIRGDGGRPVQVVERESGRLLGTVDSSSADGQVHNGAVYVHQGSTYIVAEYDLRDSVAFVDREAVAYTTWSRDVTSIEITSTLETTRWDVELPGTDSGSTPHVEWGFGNVDVHGQVVSYNRRRVPSGEILSNDPLDLPVRTLNTAAVWWSVSAELLEVAGLDMEEAPGALHAAEHASIGLLPLLATCDRWDLGGLSTSLHVDTERATVFVYDALAGGAGFAERGFGMAREWLTATLEAVKSCSCAAGCPACVQSPKCGNGNNPLSKDGAIRLLETVLFGQPQ